MFENSDIFKNALIDSLKKLNPKIQIKNFVMFIVYLGALSCSIICFVSFSSFNLQIAFWLWFTVLFANFAESIAEGRGKAQADSLRKSRKEITARKLVGKQEIIIPAKDLKKGERVLCRAGDTIPSDGEVIEGIASIDESAITGESAPVIRESGGDRSAVTGGTKVLSDWIIVSITAEAGNTFLDKMILMVEGSSRQPTPNERALQILLITLTIVFLVSVFTLNYFSKFSEIQSGLNKSLTTLPVLISLIVCLIPTTIGGLLSAIGISGIDRLSRKNVIAMSGKAVEAAGDIDVLLLDKTGTITLGNRVAEKLVPANGVDIKYLADIAQLSSLSDNTPEGRSIVILAKEQFQIRARDFSTLKTNFIPFTAETRMSGVDVTQRQLPLQKIRKGSISAIEKFVSTQNGLFPEELKKEADNISKRGETPLAICENEKVLGLITLKDKVKGGIKERFSEMRRMGIKTIMITGDNALTAASIAAEAGVDDFIAEAKPETKLSRIREEQAKGHMVAMIGDGTNDAPALAQADVGVAMNTGTQAAREAGNMIDLDSNPTKLLEIVQVGKQLLMTRGALTTFSISNDIAKYFAILPAMFGSLYIFNHTEGPLQSLNIMKLHSPESAILSAVIFNALIIILLIPFALRGVKYKAQSANTLLQKNVFIYGFCGILIPFIGIKVIDLFLNMIGAVQ